MRTKNRFTKTRSPSQRARNLRRLLREFAVSNEKTLYFPMPKTWISQAFFQDVEDFPWARKNGVILREMYYDENADTRTAIFTKEENPS